MLIEALGECGYVNPVTAASTEEKVRRLVRRLNIAARDAEVCSACSARSCGKWVAKGARTIERGISCEQ